MPSTPKKISKARTALEAHPGVLFSYVYGSVARGEATPRSDIDFAVFLGEGEDLVETKLDLIGRLSDAVGSDAFDLVVLNTAPLSLAGRIVRDRKILTERDPPARHRYESLTLRKFFDFSRTEADILDRRYGFGR